MLSWKTSSSTVSSPREWAWRRFAADVRGGQVDAAARQGAARDRRIAAVRNVLAEDQVIGMRVRQAGYSIRLSHHVVENMNSSRSLKWFLNRHSRWYKIRRQLALPVFLAEPLANLATVGLVWAFSGDSGVAWNGLLFLVGLGMLRDAVQTRRLRGSFPQLKHLLYSPVKDILLLPVWLDAVFNRRGAMARPPIPDRAHDAARRARVPRRVRRRVSRVNKFRAQNSEQRDRHSD